MEQKSAVVAVAACADSHVLEACSAANARGIAKFVLVGDIDKTREIAAADGFNLDGFDFINEPDNIAACAKAVSLVKNGEASSLMKGLIDTGIIIKAALDKENGIRTGRKLSHIAAFEIASYDKLLFITDAAINIAPSLQDKQEIIHNAVLAMTNLGISDPKVALIAAKEKPDEKMPCTMDYLELIKIHQSGGFAGINFEMDGPLALDNAISREACEIKGIDSPIGGCADLIFAPYIEVGNVLYKALAFLANARNGGVVLGASRPIILTSRADSSESKLISIALSVLC
jgi:phosphate butyryltransferase